MHILKKSINFFTCLVLGELGKGPMVITWMSSSLPKQEELENCDPPSENLPVLQIP